MKIYYTTEECGTFKGPFESAGRTKKEIVWIHRTNRDWASILFPDDTIFDYVLKHLARDPWRKTKGQYAAMESLSSLTVDEILDTLRSEFPEPPKGPINTATGTFKHLDDPEPRLPGELRYDDSMILYRWCTASMRPDRAEYRWEPLCPVARYVPQENPRPDYGMRVGPTSAAEDYGVRTRTHHTPAGDIEVIESGDMPAGEAIAFNPEDLQYGLVSGATVSARAINLRDLSS